MRLIALCLGLAALCGDPGLADAQVKEGYLPGAEGVRLFYRLVGPGKDTVVLLHGGPGTGMREGYNLESLTERGHAVLMYDQRGAGGSDLVSAPSRLTLSNHVADLEAVRKYFGLRRLTLVGFSWGGAIALHYAVAYPGSVDRIALLSPMAPTGILRLRRFRALDSLRSADTRAGLRRIDSLWALAPDADLPALCRENLALSQAEYQEGGADAVPPRGDVCDYEPRVLRNRRTAVVAALTAMGVEYDFAPALQRVSRPLLVIEGERSRMPLDAARYWAENGVNARLLLLPAAGHRTWLDQPGQVTAALETFFQGEWPEGANKVSHGD